MSNNKSTSGSNVIINVSNRLPVTIKDSEIVKSSGGLVTALEGVKTQLKWIGWPGGAADMDETKQEELTNKLESQFGYTPIFLNQDEIEDFYDGMSNSSLWPILHYNLSAFRYQEAWWQAYVTINARFADTVDRIAGEGDMVWVHDYHLFLLPQLLRERRPDLKIGFFLHVPFPSHEVFRCHPKRKELLEGLLGCDLVGFHTFGYLRHFRSSVLRVAGLESEMFLLHHDDRVTSMGVFPIGINYAKFEKELAQSPTYKEKLAEFSQTYKDKRVILGVERLDYTKGIPQKLSAMEVFLETHPEARENTVMILIAVPSRESVGSYAQLKTDIELSVSRINGLYSTISNIPIHFINRGVAFDELCALYSLADIGMVTPLIDGMNLVAKEYVACQKDRSGVLMLSEFAGAAQELFNSVLVNPYDVDGMSQAIAKALKIDEDRSRDLMLPMHKLVATNDSQWWAREFVTKLDSASKSSLDSAIKLNRHTLAKFASSPSKKALFLDYDGTLRSFTVDPKKATPSKALLEILAKLDKREDLDVFIISGRNGAFLEKHLGHFGFTLIAEHGFSAKVPGGQFEEVVNNVDLNWMASVREIFDFFASTTPGVHVEQKRSALVWHYRAADPEFGQFKAIELSGHLAAVISNVPAEVSNGKKIVEVSSSQVNKGMAVERILQDQEYSAVLCIGDDQTDETMFRQHRDRGVVTIKVGPGSTRAEFRVASTKQVHAMLALIAGLTEEGSVTSLAENPLAYPLQPFRDWLTRQWHKNTADDDSSDTEF